MYDVTFLPRPPFYRRVLWAVWRAVVPGFVAMLWPVLLVAAVLSRLLFLVAGACLLAAGLTLHDHEYTVAWHFLVTGWIVGTVACAGLALGRRR